MMMNDFINQYQSKDLYMVHHITGDMRNDISLPRPLQCGGFQRMLVDAVLWLSSGGTKSVLHNDEFNNFNCLLEGRKEIILIDQVYRSQVEADGFMQQGHYSLVDVDMVDIHKFPGLSQVPFYAVTLHSGDCIYMPARWYHQVRSFGSRNMAFNIWFAQLLYYNADDCDKVGSLPEFRSLADYSFTGHTEQMRASILEEFVSLEVISIEDCRRQWSQKLKDAGSIDELFHRIDINNDKHLSWHELYAFDILEIARRFPLLFSAEENEVDDTPSDSDHRVMLNMPHDEL
ncbi:bifunctional peptidase and arginyl-hydroxylase JMJD5-like isoform X2 [Lineus longissimus]